MEFEDTILFSVFGLPVSSYALCLTVSLGAGLLLFFALGRKRGFSWDTLYSLALKAVPLGLIGARAFYCAARVYLYLEIGLKNVFYLWYGGYALWGAVGGAALAGYLTAKQKRVSAASLLDSMAAPGALMIALARFSEYFSGEGRGLYVENESLCFFPLSVFRADYEEWHFAVFMLEGIAALVICFVLLKGGRKEGRGARLFLLLYSACQIILESMREDNSLRWLFVRVSQLTAALVIGGMMAAAAIRWARDKKARRMTGKTLLLCWAAVLLSVGTVVAMEFSMGGKILVNLPTFAAYGIIALCCAVIGASAYRVIFISRDGA